MNSKDLEDGGVPRLLPPWVFLLVAVGFAGWFARSSYVSPRPVAERSEWDEHHDAGTLEALVTEDPLRAVHRARESARAAPVVRNRSRRLVEEAAKKRRAAELQRFRDALSPLDGRPTLLLPVWQPGGDWPEECERRVRARHAVVTALSVAGYELEALRAVGTAEFEFEPGSAGKTTCAVAYDRFRATPPERPADSVKYGRVVVVWLDENALRPHPYQRVARLVEALRGSEKLDKERLQVIHVGPSSSGSLLELCDELETSEAAVEDFHLHSPFATASEAIQRAKRLATELQGFHFSAQIGDDDLIAQLLVGELFQRLPNLLVGVRPPVATRSGERESWLVNCADWLRHLTLKPFRGIVVPAEFDPEPLARVAVVAEQDSAYGRQWKRRLRNAVDELSKSGHFGISHAQAAGKQEQVKRPRQFPISFEFVPYIGVIDGAGADAVARPSAYPEGPGQLDYLQRLEVDLADERFDAVGIFGTDVYDALMILQALRPRFPGVLFFTIDLDARFLHPAHIAYTRNLIVASHLGIDEVHGPAQFRDVYEHSLFRTVSSIALEPKSSLCGCSAEPKLFEIGRTAAVPLNTPWLAAPAPPSVEAQPSGELAASGGGVGAAGTANSRSRAAPSRTTLGALAIGVSALWAGLVAYALLTKTGRNAFKRSSRWLTAGAIVLPILAVWSGHWLWTDYQAAASYAVMEPLSLAEGVSGWTAIALRLGAFVFCVAACFRIRSRLVALFESVRTDHAVAKATPQPKRPGLPLSWLFDRRDGTVLLDDLWRSFGVYARDGSGLLLRTFIAALVFAAAFWALSPLDASVAPLRGAVAHSLEAASRWLAHLGFAAVVYVTLESSCVANRLVVCIGDAWCVRLSRSTKNAAMPNMGPPPSSSHLLPRLRIAAEILRVVDGFVIYPTIAVCIFIVGRSSLLDAWTWPTTHVVGLAYAFLLVLLCVWRSRGAAAHARAEALSHVRRQRFRNVWRPKLEKLYSELLREIEGTTGGPFAPFWSHPLVRSTALSALTYVSTVMAEPRVVGLLEVGPWAK